MSSITHRTWAAMYLRFRIESFAIKELWKGEGAARYLSSVLWLCFVSVGIAFTQPVSLVA